MSGRTSVHCLESFRVATGAMKVNQAIVRQFGRKPVGKLTGQYDDGNGFITGHGPHLGGKARKILFSARLRCVDDNDVVFHGVYPASG